MTQALPISHELIAEANAGEQAALDEDYDALGRKLARAGIAIDAIKGRVAGFSVAVPTWGAGRGGTRFAKFPIAGEPTNIHEKLEDCAVINQLCRVTPRVWYTDHALHGDEPTTDAASRIVSYVPTLQQALRDLAAWVEKGTPPPASTTYRIVKGQVVVPPTAAERHGIQPVVTLRVDGAKRIEVKAGQPVTFAGTIDVPPGAGSVIAADWDFDGSGNFADKATVGHGQTHVSLSAIHRFDKAGTYFVGLRGFSQRQGNAATLYTRIRNLDRVRVVVR
jgi:hypothetical protein